MCIYKLVDGMLVLEVVAVFVCSLMFCLVYINEGSCSGVPIDFLVAERSSTSQIICY